jgi:serine/threonine protein kinase
VIKFHETYEDDQYIYIFMEYMDNAVGLDQLISEKIKGQAHLDYELSVPLIPEQEVRHLMFMLIQGCDHFHQQNIVHRDLKPDNILIDP